MISKFDKDDNRGRHRQNSQRFNCYFVYLFNLLKVAYQKYYLANVIVFKKIYGI